MMDSHSHKHRMTNQHKIRFFFKKRPTGGVKTNKKKRSAFVL